MKPYFAKWVPVDGPIEKGDYVKWGNVVGPVLAAGGKDIKKVKLFLYNPIIEVGAFARWSTLDSWSKILEVNIDDEWIILDDNKRRLYMYECEYRDYEPIGEISPDAYGYVKDGQRFDESEVELWAIVNSISTGYKDMVVLLSKWLNHKYTDNQYTVLCKIKGPCGHFH